MKMNVWSVTERLILGFGGRQGLSVLVFHRVHRRRDALRPNEPTESEFSVMMKFISENFHVVPLHRGVTSLQKGTRPFHGVAVTFDDGYADNYELALPILRQYGVPATFFVASGLLNGGLMWNDRIIEAVRGNHSVTFDLGSLGLGRFNISTIENKRLTVRKLIRALKYRPAGERVRLALAIQDISGCDVSNDLMMTSSQLRLLASDTLTEIGGHTVSHPILAQLPEREAVREIADCKQFLEGEIGERLRCFAYPNGIPGLDYTRCHVEIVRKTGFELAVSTSAGGLQAGSDRFQLPRFTPWDRKSWRFGLRLLYVGRQQGAVVD